MASANPDRNPAAKPDRTWFYVAAGFILAWGIYLAFFGPPMITAELPLNPNGPFPDADYSWQLLDLEDQTVPFASFKGKTVFLNIWATWCGPCVKEMPSIARLAADPRLKDVTFLCVSTDDSPAPIKTFLERKNFPMTMLRATGAPEVFHTDGIPATFIISPEGKVVSSTIGSADWDRPDVVEFLLNQLKPAGAGKDEKQAE